MSIAFYAAVAVAGAWVGLILTGIHETVQQDGSWYNELKLEGRCTYRNRLFYTLRNRVYLGRCLAALVGGAVALWAFVYVFVMGLVAILSGTGWLA